MEDDPEGVAGLRPDLAFERGQQGENDKDPKSLLVSRFTKKAEMRMKIKIKIEQREWQSRLQPSRAGTRGGGAEKVELKFHGVCNIECGSAF